MKLRMVRTKQNKILTSLFALLIFSVSLFYQTQFSSKKPSSINSSLVKVVRVIDGDTIEIEGGKKVRYIGINTPETQDPRKPVECFGREAKEKNIELIQDKEIKLVKDISETDKYGRLLRYVYVEDVFINLELVKQGFAVVSTYPPDIKYQKEFLEAEKQAREKNLGLWNKCL